MRLNTSKQQPIAITPIKKREKAKHKKLKKTKKLSQTKYNQITKIKSALKESHNPKKYQLKIENNTESKILRLNEHIKKMKNLGLCGGNEYHINIFNKYASKCNLPKTALERLQNTYTFYLTKLIQGDFDFLKQLTKSNLKAAKNIQNTLVIGDIHGDINQLLTGLLASQVLECADPPIIMYKCGKTTFKIRKTITIESYLKLSTNEQIGYQPIPNFKFKTPKKGNIIIMGDILDRGEHDQVCLAILMNLAHKKNSTINIIMGDHEAYGHEKGKSANPQFIPTNYTHTTNTLLLCKKEFFQCIRDELYYAFINKTITLAYEKDGIIFSHSMISCSWLKKIKETYFKNDNEAITYLINLLKLPKKNRVTYKKHIKKVTAQLNDILLSISKNNNTSQTQSIIYDHDGPLWSRGKSPIANYVGFHGHTVQPIWDTHKKIIKNPLKTGNNAQLPTNTPLPSSIYFIDTGASPLSSGRGRAVSQSVPTCYCIDNGTITPIRPKKAFWKKMYLGSIITS